MGDKKRELKREYQQNPRPMGVYLIRNLVNGKVLVGVSLNLPGILNRHRFQLSQGLHPNRALQTEWQEFGSASFAFEVLDELPPYEEPGYNYRADLAGLEELWLDKLEPYGDRGYNEKRKDKEERLRAIIKNRGRKS